MPLPRPCLTCGIPTVLGTYCARHRRPSSPKAKTKARGYGIVHERRAAALRAEQRPCCLCGRPINYDLRAPHPASFTAHHLTRDKAGPLDAAHRRCNEQAGRPPA